MGTLWTIYFTPQTTNSLSKDYEIFHIISSKSHTSMRYILTMLVIYTLKMQNNIMLCYYINVVVFMVCTTILISPDTVNPYWKVIGSNISKS